MNVAAILLTPFVQLGTSYWLSFSTIVAAIMLIKWRRAFLERFLETYRFSALIFVFMVGLPMVSYPDADATDFLRALREAMFFLLITTFLSARRGNLDGKQRALVINVSLGVVLLLTLLTAAQAVLFARGVNFSLPRQFFIMNELTLPDEQALADSVVRPIGTFGEPSYLGFVLFSFAYCFSVATRRSWQIKTMLVSIGIACILVRSLSFVLALSFYFVATFYGQRYLSMMQATLLALALVFGLELSGFLDIISTRLSNIGNASLESSGHIRIVGPGEIILTFLEEYPFGVPSSRLSSALDPIITQNVDPIQYQNNAIWNFLFYCGWSGIPLFLYLIMSTRDLPTRIYILFCAVFNGALLSVDKFALMTLFIGMHKALSGSRRLRHSGAVSRSTREGGRPRGETRFPSSPAPSPSSREPGEIRRGSTSKRGRRRGPRLLRSRLDQGSSYLG